MGVWYKSTRPTQIELYYRNQAGAWLYWTASPAFPATSSWKKAAWTTPATPPGATAVSFGLTADSNITLTSTAYSLRPAKDYHGLVLLGSLAFVIVAAGLIARGQLRYRKHVRAEAELAAEEDSDAERLTACARVRHRRLMKRPATIAASTTMSGSEIQVSWRALPRGADKHTPVNSRATSTASSRARTMRPAGSRAGTAGYRPPDAPPAACGRFQPASAACRWPRRCRKGDPDAAGGTHLLAELFPPATRVASGLMELCLLGTGDHQVGSRAGEPEGRDEVPGRPGSGGASTGT